ncbi:exoribonuclease II [Buchnera aphidicola]|uniref:exoribonuclease II n=1 Tax=Buchnera aphidicola TaxID=9 RepID=UPI00346398EA
MLQYKKKLLELKNKFHVHTVHVIGLVKKYDKRYGFLKITSKINYVISKKYIKQVMHGDRITAIIYTQKNQEFVKPHQLIKPFLNIFIGKINKKNDVIFIKPDYPFLQECLVYFDNYSDGMHVQDGDWFIAKLFKHKLRDHESFKAKLIKFVTSAYDKLIPWKITLSHYHLEYHFPKINSCDTTFNFNISRKDLTHLSFITIDNENTQDIDDAIFLEKHGSMINLIIAISDPTAYITEGSNLDILASKRLFTNYLPGINLPMLPKELSEDVFSLHANFKKPVLACEVQINEQGNISKSNFFLAWICSHAQLTYNNVTNWVTKNGVWNPNNKKITNQINLLYELCQKRISWRKKNSLIFQDKLEYQFHFTYDYEIINITTMHRNIAQKMIEETMIIANICAAKFLSMHLGFGIYNAHLGFNHIYINRISYILKDNNIDIDISKIHTFHGFCKIRSFLNNISNDYINNRIIKYQSTAFMSLIPQPHFALGLTEYLTWTSPIRKYSDMVNHRLLKSIILQSPSKKPNSTILKNIMKCKKKYHIIKKNIENWLYIQFFQKTNILHKNFEAEIFNLTPYGMQALLLINGATIFIPIYHVNYDQKKILCDQDYGIYYFKGKIIYQVSDKILVTIIAIKIESRKIFAKVFS